MIRALVFSLGLAVAIPAIQAPPENPKPTIRIENFNERYVEVFFPDEQARLAFWNTILDLSWPKDRRTSDSFEKTWGPIMKRPTKTAKIDRHHLFDRYSWATAAMLRNEGITLEVIESECSKRSKRERVIILPECR